MRLSDEQKKVLLKRLSELVQGAPKCALCTSEEWELSDTIFQLPDFIGGVGFMMVGGPVYPVIPMTCARCGHTVLLNALRFGVLERPQSPSAGPPEAAPEPTEQPQ
jgi:hypothetical protein